MASAAVFSAAQKLSRNHFRDNPAAWVTPMTCHAPGTAQAEGMHTALGVDGQLAGVSKNHATGADGSEGASVLDHACADRRRRIVARTADDQRRFGQTRQGAASFDTWPVTSQDS